MNWLSENAKKKNKKKNLKENIQVKQFSCDFPKKIRNSQIIT